MKRRTLFLALAVVIASLAAVQSPAAADHAGKAVCLDNSTNCRHWGNGYSPPVYSNYAIWGHNFIQDAGYFWQDNGFRQGWNPGAFPSSAGNECAFGGDYIRHASIVVCWVPPGHAQLAGQKGATDVLQQCDNACNHIRGATIYINWDLSPTDRQLILRHEMGHALGLGHNNAEHGSVMHLPVTSPYATSHDWVAMYLEMYNLHH